MLHGKIWDNRPRFNNSTLLILCVDVLDITLPESLYSCFALISPPDWYILHLICKKGGVNGIGNSFF